MSRQDFNSPQNIKHNIKKTVFLFIFEVQLSKRTRLLKLADVRGGEASAGQFMLQVIVSSHYNFLLYRGMSGESVEALAHLL